MDQVVTDAIAVLRGLLKSESETVRLQAAAAILQFIGAAEDAGDAGEAMKTPLPATEATGQDSSQTLNPGIVRANRFELIDSGGKVLAVLGKVEKHPFDGEGVGPGVGLALFDDQGRPQVRLCADNHNGVITSQGLTVYDLSGEYRINVGASPGGGGLGMKHGVKGYFEVFIADQSPILRFKDKDEKQRVFLALDTFQLLAANGSVLFKAPGA